MANDAVARMRQATRVEGAADLIASYFEPEGPFAGSTFHELSPNDPASLQPADLLATSLLDVSFKPAAVRRLLIEHEPTEFIEWLRPTATPVETELGSAEGIRILGSPHTREAWDALQELEGVGPVIAGKLMARKRPSLIPIVDEVVVAIVAAPPHEYWQTYGEALRDPEILENLESMRRGDAGSTPSLRLLDALIWMLGSNSQNAQRVRSEVGLSQAPWRPNE